MGANPTTVDVAIAEKARAERSHWQIIRIGQFWVGAELALAGLVLLMWKRNGVAQLYALPLVLFPLPYYITHVYVRFQYIVDPLLVILAAYALEGLLSWLRPKRETAKPAVVSETA